MGYRRNRVPDLPSFPGSGTPNNGAVVEQTVIEQAVVEQTQYRAKQGDQLTTPKLALTLPGQTRLGHPSPRVSQLLQAD